MNKTLGTELLVWGLMLGGSGFLARQFAPDHSTTLFVAGAAGGILCLVLGALALLGRRRKAWSILTLAALCYVALSQSVHLWMTPPAESGSIRLAAALATFMLAGSMALVMHIAYSGMGQAGKT